ncbi:MAG: MotA/TolQ/ExbB proton channel family protein [Leptospiraceae bacterium]|nr:MotA/TolQ/ExbB proton channel family protein [Leptospiraceae bacterium]MCK6382172.1 MotA/TolQ/ExbB proton channel family protein [Leptospiraceae bacterium]NUM40993.1 MotA/TolQ/ExbB proton channel family protein [Leptospiraceae bacterium]
MFPLLCVSILNLSLVIHLFFEFRSIQKDLFLENTDQLRTPFGRSFFKILEDTRDIEKRWEEKFEHLIFSYEKKINWVGSLGGIATLLGLLGTVLGIYSAFQKMRATGQASPEIFAGGISEALLTTIFGLLIAVPSLVFHQYLKGELDEIETESFGIVYRVSREKKS